MAYNVSNCVRLSRTRRPFHDNTRILLQILNNFYLFIIEWLGEIQLSYPVCFEHPISITRRNIMIGSEQSPHTGKKLIINLFRWLSDQFGHCLR